MKFQQHFFLKGNNIKTDVSNKIKSQLESWGYVVRQSSENFYDFSIIGLPRMTDFKKYKYYNHHFRDGNLLIKVNGNSVILIWEISSSYTMMYCIGSFIAILGFGFVYSIFIETLIGGLLFSIVVYLLIRLNIKLWLNSLIKASFMVD